MKFNELLSVGAISGYSTAMTKYKLNKQTEQLTELLNNSLIQSTNFQFAKPQSGSTSYNLISYFRQMHLFSEDMMFPTNSPYYNTHVQDVFGNRIAVSAVLTNVWSQYTLSIALNNNLLDVCMNMANLIKEYHAYVYAVTFYNGSTNTVLYGDMYCNNIALCLKNTDLVKFQQYCQQCVNINIDYNFKSN